MKAAELIARAIFLSQIDGRGLDQPDAEQGKDGLFFLNMLLDEKSITTQYVPYISHTTFNSVIGQQEYFIEGLADLEVLTFVWQEVRYNLRRQTMKQYFAPPRAENIKALPVFYYSERANGGTRIFIYFLPDRNDYEFHITGKYMLQNVSYDTDLSLTLDKFYQYYLMYELAAFICQFYGITPPIMVTQKLNELNIKLRNLNPTDLTLNIISSLNNNFAFNYAQANIGKGYTVP